MISLRKIRSEEFSQYCEYFVEDYSREIVENYGYLIEPAVEIARLDLDKSFPLGPEKSKDDLLCIDISSSVDNKDGTHLAGYIWLSIDHTNKSAFICDFYVYDLYRRQGIGKQAMVELESYLQRQGINEIQLRVAYNNSRALKLYQEIGFKVTGINMLKILDTL